MMATSALTLESDPFDFLLRQKSKNLNPSRQKSIKLNLKRLPPDFFPRPPRPRPRVRRLQSLSERSPLQN